MLYVKSIYINRAVSGNDERSCVYKCTDTDYGVPLFQVESEESAERLGRKIADILDVEFYVGKPIVRTGKSNEPTLISEAKEDMSEFISKLYIARTLSDECGLYGIVSSEARRLLFASDSLSEILKYAPRIGEVLGVNVEMNDADILYLKSKESRSKESGGTKMAKEPKSKKVNLTHLCRDLLAKGTPDKKIVERLVAAHLEKGKDKAYAEKRAKVFLKYMKGQTKKQKSIEPAEKESKEAAPKKETPEGEEEVTGE